jgi:hypothetical protein
MARIAPVMSGIVRYGGLLVLVLGMVIWTGTMDALVPFHMLLGILVVLALWLLALAYLASGKASIGLAAGAFAVGLAQAALGLTQEGLLPSAHWVVQIAHLLLGLLLIGMGEMMTMRMKKARAAVAAR